MLRPARPDDAEDLRDVERAANLVALAHIFPPEEFPYPSLDTLTRWRRLLGDPAVTIIVADRDGRPIGFAAYDQQWLRHLGVHPDHWGSGLAEELCDHYLQALAAAGTTPARLWVLAENHRARRFYERTGWRPGDRTSSAEFPPYPMELDYWRPLDVSR